jgi:two-component system sensor histidine kinase/response regulator
VTRSHLKLAVTSDALPTIRDRIPAARWLLASAAILLLVAAAGLGAIALRHSQQRLIESLDKTIAFAKNVDIARDAQVHFKRQVQEWKNVLIRGHKSIDYAKYWSLFEAEETNTQTLLSELRQRDPSEAAALDGLRAELQTLGQRYRAAIAAFDPDNPRSYQVVDTQVRGMDRPPTDEMSALVMRLQIRMADLGAQMAASHQAEISTLRGAVVTAALLGVLSMVMLMLLIRRSERARAQASDQAKSAFLATMSHEIRTPMNAVFGMAHLLEHTSLTATQSDYLAKLQAASKHLLSIIDDVLDLSKIEASKLEIEHLVFSLDDVLDDVATLIGVRASEKDVELIVSRQPNVPVLLLGDPLRLGQILSNLASNAVKFTEQGEVHVSVCLRSRSADRVELLFEVRDTGIGLSPEEQSKLFRPFAQADGSTTRRFGGTGLGLAICARLVKLMNGTIGVESHIGHGSRFFFTIPFQARSEERRQQPGLPPGLRGRNILIGEPNATARFALAELLAGAGLEVSAAADGSEARAFLMQHDRTIDLALLNWQLHTPGTRELLDLAKHAAKIPTDRLIVLASHADAEEAHACLRTLNLGGLLIKPASPSAIFDAIARSFGVEQRNRSRRNNGRLAAALGKSWNELRGLRVLLVEDNGVNQEVAAATLKSVGILVEVASNGQDAVEAVHQAWDTGTPFSLVLMDRHMPGMDGLQTTRQIRLDPRCTHLPIVAMTADVVGAAREECLAAGMNDFVSKPFAVESLLQTIARWTSPEGKANASTEKPSATEFAALSSTRPGISVATGLRYLGGNMTAYRKLLHRFRLDHGQADREIRRLLALGKRADAEREAHSVKGLAGQMGADDLRACAALLESALRKDGTTIAPLIDVFAQALAVVMQELASFYSEEPPAIFPSSTPSEIFPLAERVAQLLESNDPDAQTVAEKLRDSLSGQVRLQADTLVRRLQNYDFDGARVALGGVMTTLALGSQKESRDQSA